MKLKKKKTQNDLFHLVTTRPWHVLNVTFYGENKIELTFEGTRTVVKQETINLLAFGCLN